jgi:hypothetical protein
VVKEPKREDMGWKSLVIQSALISAAVLIGIRLFTPGNTGHLEAFQKTFSDQVKLIESHLNKIERNLADQEQGSSPPSGQSALSLVLSEISQNLYSIMESLDRLENERSRSYPQQPPVSSFTPRTNVPTMRQPMGADPTAWLHELPEEKRDEVEEIFRQHADTMRAKLRNAPPLTPESMKKIVEESDNELKEKLRGVMNDAEYEKFLSSMPKPPMIESLPPPQ